MTSKKTVTKKASSKKASKKTVAKKKKVSNVGNGKRKLTSKQRRVRCNSIIAKLQSCTSGIGLEKKSAIEAEVRKLVDATLKPLSL